MSILYPNALKKARHTVHIVTSKCSPVRSLKVDIFDDQLRDFVPIYPGNPLTSC